MVDTLRSAFFRTLAGVTEKIAVLETLAVRKTYRGFAAASPNHVILLYCHLSPKQKHRQWRCLFWWEMVDSNHRRRSQQIYSLSPLATREISHIKFSKKLELVDGQSLSSKVFRACIVDATHFASKNITP